eukprot:c28439_g2_i1 orf=151-1761(+)
MASTPGIPATRVFPIRIWPPNSNTRSSLVDRIAAHLSSISFFSQKYGRIESAEAAVHAKRIEESAFLAASCQAGDDGSDDIAVVQFYAKEAGKLMLECLKRGPSSANGAVSVDVVAPEIATEFDISGGKRDFLTKESCEELLKPLSLLGNSYTKICFSNKSFGLDAAEVAGEILTALKGQLRDVNLADIVAGRQETEALSVMSIFSSALEGSNLRSLNLSDNALGEKGVRAFSSLLRSQCALEELYFMNNGISEEAARAICELLPSGEKLRIMHFYNNMTGDAGAEVLSELVKCASVLEDFRFSSTRVGSDGGIALAEALKSGTSLKRIDLRDNSFGVEGGIVLARSLKQHLDLVEAYLSYLGLEDKGATALAEALGAGAPGLRVLELAGNEITENSARAIADCISSKFKLVKLNLAENELKDKGVLTVCEVLMKGHDDLTELDFSSNDIGRIGASAAAKAVAQKPKFKLLSIDGNHISESGVEAVKEALHKGLCGVAVLGSLDENAEEEEEEDGDRAEEDDACSQLERRLDNLRM